MTQQPSPDTPVEGVGEREGGDVVGFVPGPVIGGEGTRQRHLAQSDDEVHDPQEHEQHEHLDGDDVPVTHTLYLFISVRLIHCDHEVRDKHKEHEEHQNVDRNDAPAP